MTRGTPTASTRASCATLREQLLLMGAKVEEMIASSDQGARRPRQRRSPQPTIEHRPPDQPARDRDRRAVPAHPRRAASRWPRDLRFITIALKIVTDLERIGDLGVNICERVIELNEEPPLKPYVDLAEHGRGRAGRWCARRSTRSSRATPTAPQRVIERDSHGRRVLRADLPRAPHLHDGGPAQHLPRDARAVDREVPRAHRRPRDEPRRDGRVHGARARTSATSGGSRPGASSVPHGVLFLCVQNSARSQMAEGWARKLLPAGVRIWSAGLRRPMRSIRSPSA